MKNYQFTRSTTTSYECSSRNEQRGVVLFVALVVLVVMSLGGISMMRTADTGTQIAGNLAFRQSALQAAESAFERAMQNVNALTTGGGFTSDNPGLCYRQGYLSVDSPGDLPWTGASCDLGVDTLTGNRVQLIINRLSVGTFTANTRVSGGNSPGNSKKCPGGCGQDNTYEHYRIIARVSDSKGMVTFIEEKIY